MAGVILAAVAVIYSAKAAGASGRAADAAVDLYKLEAERREAELEHSREAVVTAAFVQVANPPSSRVTDSRFSYLFEVANRGPSVAHELKVSFEESSAPLHFDAEAFPEVLRTGERRSSTFVAMPNTKVPATVRWRDGRNAVDGDPHELRVPYTFDRR